METPLTLAELRARGHVALLRELGPVDYVRFLQQIEPGRGDYTARRGEWLDGLTLEHVDALLAGKRGGDGS